MEDGPLFQRHRRIKDLASLLYSSLDLPFSQTDRLRFFKKYYGGGKIKKKAKRLIRTVERKASRIRLRERRRRYTNKGYIK
jgi:hypothetical protein